MGALDELLGQPEGQRLDRKSLMTVQGKRRDFVALAQDCVGFANASGGTLLIGVEDGAHSPPADQKVDGELIDRVRARIGELTVNVHVQTEHAIAADGGELILLHVPRGHGVASTSDGRYFLRVGDQTQPIVGDDVLRLATERPQVPWELLTTLRVAAEKRDPEKTTALVDALRRSDRVKPSVKEKSDEELLAHYHLMDGDLLTNLGVLLIGRAADRARLGSAPVVQAIRYDDRNTKIGKIAWDDHTLSPIELVDAVWEGVPDFAERYEMPDGMLRKEIPAYEEVVVRELLVNALVHRPYTQRGDIFLNLHPDRLEVVNPGRFPLGVTPSNILRQSRRRNDALARVFHDIGLMEREGSGFDTIYDRLLSTGRGAPEASEGPDSVHVVIPRRVVHPGVVRLLTAADQRYHLTQRERISLGLLAQTEGLRAAQLAQLLGIESTDELRRWLGELVRHRLVTATGRTRAVRYFVPPELLRSAGLDERTTLERVEPHRLRALILEDLDRHPESSSTEIHERIGPEIPVRTFRRELQRLTEQGEVHATGKTRGRRYWPTRFGQGSDLAEKENKDEN